MYNECLCVAAVERMQHNNKNHYNNEIEEEKTVAVDNKSN